MIACYYYLSCSFSYLLQVFERDMGDKDYLSEMTQFTNQVIIY